MFTLSGIVERRPVEGIRLVDVGSILGREEELSLMDERGRIRW